MEIDCRVFIASLGGGATAVSVMGHEAQGGGQTYPTVAELVAQIETRTSRRGVGRVFVGRDGNMSRLPRMPAKSTLQDFFELRFAPANHVLQSTTRALKTGMSEEIILACLLHDTVHTLMRADHGWWGAQLYEPYVPEKTSVAIRYHQTLRFYPDFEAGYEYPELYLRIFGVDYQPPPHIEAAYKFVRNHKWYMEPRLVTVNDLYSFDRSAVVSIDPFIDIFKRHFKQPKEDLGNDNSSVAHMWRTIINPDVPL